MGSPGQGTAPQAVPGQDTPLPLLLGRAYPPPRQDQERMYPPSLLLPLDRRTNASEKITFPRTAYVVGNYHEKHECFAALCHAPSDYMI